MLRLAPHLKHHFVLCLYTNTFAFAPRVISIPANKSIAHISFDEAKKHINFGIRIFEHRLKGSSVGGLKGPRFDIELLRTEILPCASHLVSFSFWIINKFLPDF